MGNILLQTELRRLYVQFIFVYSFDFRGSRGSLNCENHLNPDFTYFHAPEILVVIICVSVSCLVLLRGHEV